MTTLHGARRKRRNPAKITFMVIAGVLVLALAAAGVYLVVLGQSFDSGTHKLASVFPDEANRPAESTTGAQNILLLGSDTRAENDGSLEDLTGQRSDTMMVAHIPADKKQVYVMSILRDSWLEIPGHGSAKINAALSFGGVPLAVETVEELIGSRIDHVAVIDFEGFKGVTDALGGVDVDSTTNFSAGGYQFFEGAQQLNGDQALAFVRERSSFADGDYQRARNQQAYLKAVLGKTLSAKTLSDPAKLSALVGSIAPYLAVDEDLNSAYLGGMALGMTGLRSDNISFFTAPTLGVGSSDDGQSIVLIDWDKMAEVKNAFETDTLGEYTP